MICFLVKHDPFISVSYLGWTLPKIGGVCGAQVTSKHAHNPVKPGGGPHRRATLNPRDKTEHHILK
jgi:hypothetical protein